LFRWQPKLDLEQMCRDHWNFQKRERDKMENGTRMTPLAHDPASEVPLNETHLPMAVSRDVLN
jgi:hypothetical protein